ncbi:hypothetical protein I5Q83_04420 [Enterocloster clostridioformis]|nr:hypothetical protein [Enterocloster clostridioformis]QQR04227.1 hypothetical protein I5Q83_04420 [Enterocloster clostridioformis]
MRVIFSNHAKFVRVLQPASLSLYFNSGTRGQEGAVTIVIFKLNRSV